MTIAVGQVVHDRYRIIRKLGEGGMGAVYEVEHIQLGRRLALKTLHPQLVRNEELVARFQREARAAAAIGSPHIVDVVDLGSVDGTPFIAMEFLDGGSLRDLLAEQGQIQVSRALGIVGQACKALAAAHAKGIVHRDLKPDNLVVIEREGADFVKIVDFGIAKLVEDSIALDAVATTRTGVTMGTPHYMSPEQIAGESDIDARADVWAMGCVLFELLTGRAPFEANTLPMLAAKIHSETPPAVSALRAGIPPRLDALVSKSLAKERRDRFATIADMGAAIDALKMSPAATTQKPAHAFGDEEDTRVDTSPAGAETQPPRITTTPQAWESSPPARSSRYALVAIMVAVGVLAVVGGLALAVVFGDPSGPTRRPATIANLDTQPTPPSLGPADGPLIGPEPAPSVAPAGTSSETTSAAPTTEQSVSPSSRARRTERSRPNPSSNERALETLRSAPATTPAPPDPPPAPAARLAPPPVPATRRVAIRNIRQLTVTVTLTCGNQPPVEIRVSAGATRSVDIEGACRVRCDDGVSVGSLCGTRLSATATALVIR